MLFCRLLPDSSRESEIILHKEIEWFNAKFLHVLAHVWIIALLFAPVILFSFKGE